MDKNIFDLQIAAYLPVSIRRLFSFTDKKIFSSISEIRLCSGARLVVECFGKRKFIGNKGMSDRPDNAYTVTKEDISNCIELLTRSSLYAYNRFINEGYLTLPGGHRVGLTGKCIVENNTVVAMNGFNSVIFRISHFVQGAADLVFADIYSGHINNTLIISPPGCGKTTLLKDIIRNFIEVGNSGKIINCVVVDERAELIAQNIHTSQNHLQAYTPVVYECPKVLAIPMVVRSMSPDVIVVDELATAEDMFAVKYAAASGCSIIATTHGSDESNNEILLHDSAKVFRKIIVLSCRHGPGTIEKVLDGIGYD